MHSFLSSWTSYSRISPRTSCGRLRRLTARTTSRSCIATYVTWKITSKLKLVVAYNEVHAIWEHLSDKVRELFRAADSKPNEPLRAVLDVDFFAGQEVKVVLDHPF